MNLRTCASCPSAAFLSAVLVCVLLASAAARDQALAPPPRGPANPVSNTNHAEFAAPQSVFDIPKAPVEGKDPFFPDSMRLFASQVPVQASTNRFQAPAPAPAVVELRLQGISGPPERRLAIINTRTFAAGEEEEVPTNAGRTRIRCVEIGADSVVVLVGQQRRELRPRAGF